MRFFYYFISLQNNVITIFQLFTKKWKSHSILFLSMKYSFIQEKIIIKNDFCSLHNCIFFNFALKNNNL